MSQEKIERWDAVKGNDAPQDKLSVFLLCCSTHAI